MIVNDEISATAPAVDIGYVSQGVGMVRNTQCLVNAEMVEFFSGKSR